MTQVFAWQRSPGAYFCNVEWDEVRQTDEFFWVKLSCKMSDLFSSFYWLSDFFQKDLNLKDKLQIWGFENLFAGLNLDFLDVSGSLSQYNFQLFRSFFSAPYQKRASYSHSSLFASGVRDLLFKKLFTRILWTKDILSTENFDVLKWIILCNGGTSSNCSNTGSFKTIYNFTIPLSYF